MNKIKDRITLGTLVGSIGALAGLLSDQLFFRTGISKRSWPTTAAGVWLSSRKQAETWLGQIFGITMTFGLCVLGAFKFIDLLSKYGRDKVILKGAVFGTTFSAIIHALLGGMVNKKLKPQDARTNLSYTFTGALFGILTTLAISKLGHDSLFDAQPQNDNLKPTEKTTEEYLE